MTRKIKALFVIAFIFLALECFGADKEIPVKPFAIEWNVKYNVPDVKGNLIIKNEITGKEFKIPAKDFLIREKAYKNWRTLEVKNPVITDIEQGGDDIIVTFNYFDDDTKSILSGKFIVSIEYIKEQTNSKKELFLIGGLSATTVYSILVTILLILL